jgi:hypothetical protein
VTDYSEHIGNTFGPNGFWIGSTRSDRDAMGANRRH